MLCNIIDVARIESAQASSEAASAPKLSIREQSYFSGCLLE